MLITPSEMGVGNVLVSTTENKGHDPDFWADSAADRIVSVGGNCHPAIAEQANEFKRAVIATVLFYIKEAIRSDRVTLAAEFENQGHADMANIIRVYNGYHDCNVYVFQERAFGSGTQL